MSSKTAPVKRSRPKPLPSKAHPFLTVRLMLRAEVGQVHSTTSVP